LAAVFDILVPDQRLDFIGALSAKGQQRCPKGPPLRLGQTLTLGRAVLAQILLCDLSQGIARVRAARRQEPLQEVLIDQLGLAAIIRLGGSSARHPLLLAFFAFGPDNAEHAVAGIRFA